MNKPVAFHFWVFLLFDFFVHHVGIVRVLRVFFQESPQVLNWRQKLRLLSF